MSTPDPTVVEKILRAYRALPPERKEPYLDEVCGDDHELRARVEQALRAPARPPAPDPDATVDLPAPTDPDATIDLPAPSDPEATIDLPSPGAGGLDPEATVDLDQGPDPDATLDFGDPPDSDATVDLAGEGARGNDPGRPKNVSALPEQIGDFRIIGLLGEGGMGAVYLADQLHPRRRVALKVIKAKIISEEAIKRFEVEGETLAKLSHPGVAQVFAAGIESTRDGSLPFFAMEYVDEARTITEWAIDRKLDLRQRLELFVEACDALSHAHQRGIIHRDLKPGNVLVNDRGQLKVIDFGVAQVEEEQQAAGSSPKQIVGTLQYMPPEQVRGEQDIDTSCDVYAFGVVLYQMLVDDLPYQIDTTSMSNAITSVIEAPTPSLLSVDPGLGKDLDAIIGKALAKDRDDRYTSAAELGADIRRYLADEPITAREQTSGEAIRRFMRKNRTATSAILIILLVIVTGLVSVSVFAYRAEIARIEENRQRLLAEEATRRVELQRERLAKIVDFQSAMIKEIEPSRMGATLRDSILDSTRYRMESADLDIEEIEFALADLEDDLERFNTTEVAIDLFATHVLEGALETIPRKFDGDPQTEADVREIIADSYEILGRYQLAEPEYRRALAIRRELLGPDDPRTLEAASDLGNLMMLQGRFDEAQVLLDEAVEGRRRVMGPDHAETIASMQNLGRLRYEQREFQPALELWDEAYKASVRVNGELYPISIMLLGNLGAVHAELGQLEIARDHLTRELDLNERAYGEESIQTLLCLRNLADIAIRSGDVPAGADYMERALAGFTTQLGDRHPDTLSASSALGIIRLRHQGRVAEAQEILRAAYQGQSEQLGPFHPDTFTTLQILAQCHLTMGDFDGFKPVANLAYKASVAIHGPVSDQSLQWLQARALVARDTGSFAESEEVLLEMEALCGREDLQSQLGRQICSAIPALYSTLYQRWHAAEPGQGYDEKAARWNDVLQDASPGG